MGGRGGEDRESASLAGAISGDTGSKGDFGWRIGKAAHVARDDRRQDRTRGTTAELTGPDGRESRERVDR